MTSPIPTHWRDPAPPRRPGPVRRWVAWWGRWRRPSGQPWDGSNIIVAGVLAWLIRWAFPSPEAEGFYVLVLWVWLVWLLGTVLASAARWLRLAAGAAAMLWRWLGTAVSSGASLTRSVIRAAGPASVAKAVRRAVRRARSG